MKKKVIVGILIFLVVLGVVFSRFLTPYVFDALILVVSVMASIEISNCLNKIGKGAFPVASGLFGFFSYVLFFVPYILKASWWWFLILQIDLFILFILVLSVVCLVKKFSFSRLWWTVFSFIYPCMLLYFFYPLNHLNAILNVNANLGILGITMVLAVSCVTDTMAMFMGILLKGPKVWPKASPNKTWSGCISGSVFAILIGIVVYFSFNAFASYNAVFTAYGIKFWMFMIVAFVGSIFNQVGDFLESFFKRKCGVKDTSNYLSSHGGFMDRVDGWCFNALATYFCMLIMFI